MANSKRTSSDPDGTSSGTRAPGAADTRRTPGIVGGLVVGLLLSLGSLFTSVQWAVKVALVATALLGIAGYTVVHVVHMYDEEPDDEEPDDEASGAGPDAPAPDDDKDIPQ